MNDKHLHDKNFAVVTSGMTELEARYAESRKHWEQVAQTLELPPAPLQVDIELTNICDIRCLMCERKYMRRTTGMMSTALFKQIIDDCAKSGVESVKLNLWGESLLHKELLSMVQYAKDNSSLILQFNTNANRLSSEISRGLILAGLDKLTISIDGVSSETYQKVRIGGNYRRVIENVETLLELKQSYGSVLPVVTLQIIAMTETKHEIDAFVETWQDRVDCVSVTNIFTTNKSHDEIDNLSLRRNTNTDLQPCSQLWQRLSILWDGVATVCCNDYDGALAIGNVHESSITELWQCEKLNQLRENHKDLNFSRLICRKCENILAYK